MNKITASLFALTTLAVCRPVLGEPTARLQWDWIPATGTSPNGYVTFYNDDNPGPPPAADYFSAADAQDALDSLESSHGRFTYYGFNAPYFSNGAKPMFIYACGDGGFAPEDSILLDAPDNRGGPEPWIRSTVLHELFHHVQYAYIAFDEWQSWGTWTVEGTARLMEDKTFPDLDTDVANTRYYGEVNGYLRNPSRSLTDLSYASCLFWNYLTEQYGPNKTQFFVGTAIIRTFWEHCAPRPPNGLLCLNHTIAEYAPWERLKDIFIDFLVANYTKDLDVSDTPDGSRYTYLDDDDTDANGNPVRYAAVARTTYALPPNVLNVADSVPSWAGKWYDATVSGTPQVVGFQVRSTNNKPLTAAAISVKSGNRVSQIFKSSGHWEFAIAFFNRASDPLTSIVGVVGGLDDAVSYEYTFGQGLAKVMIMSPTNDYPAYVGLKDNPERFVAKVRVMGADDLGTPSVRGLHYTDFTARVGAEDAEILDGTYVQGDYWLLIQAPEQTAAGEAFDLNVTFGTISAGREDSVIYRKIVRDQIMLIDGSGSMIEGGKIVAAKNAASLLVDTKPDGDMVGVVRFHGNEEEPDVDATVEFELTNVDNVSRENAKAEIQAIGASPWAWTSLGDGVDVSQEQLDTLGRPEDKHVIVLLSDGRENEAIYWSAVKPEILLKGTVIHTIALGPETDQFLMESIATDTGGEYYYVTTATTGALSPAGEPLANRLADVYKQVEEEISGHQRLWYARGLLAPGAKTEHYFDLTEDGVGDAVIAVNWEKESDVLDVSMEDPDGNTIKPGTPGVQYFDARTHAVYRLPSMKPGKWTIFIGSKAGGPTEYVASISGQILHGVDLELYIRQPYLNRWVGLPVQIIANLTDMKGPIRGASVVGTVFHPKDTTYNVKLKDDGNHNDENADDGIYANEFTRTTEDGSYVVEVRATGTSNYGQLFERVKSRVFSVRYDREKLDSDKDGMPDMWEILYGLVIGKDDSKEDKDADGVLNIEEFLAGTNPNDPDTDSGGECDLSELKRGSDPCEEDDDSIPRPVDVGVVEERTCPDGAEGRFEPNANLIHFPVDPAYKSLLLFRHKGPAVSPGDFILIDEIDPMKYRGIYPDRELGNGVEYFYFLVAKGLNDAQSARSPIFSGVAKDDPVPPKGWVEVNDGAWRTTSLDVTLTFDPSPDSTGVVVSNDPSFKGAMWQAKPVSMPWTLEPIPGTPFATVYAKFRDPAGNVSCLEHDSVVVDVDADADDDSILDIVDLDDDNDWLPDVLEAIITLDAFRPDSDGDGILDAFEDTDGDRQNNYVEFVGGSDPGDPRSVFRGHVEGIAQDKILIQWPYVPGRRYRLLFSDEMGQRTWQPVPGEYKVDGNVANQEDFITGVRKRYYKVEAYAIPPDFNGITKDDIASAPLSSNSIDGSDGTNQLTPGSIILCRTSQGRYCKFLIENFDPSPVHTLTIRWVTYNPDGAIYSRGSGLTVRGTSHCDLDEGLETRVDSDFWWVQISATRRYLQPENGATFYKAW